MAAVATVQLSLF